ncbi:MAG: hypothetical protein H6981_05120 [Gammaproteobacteria bacterium]|nr:hypothetical protein [Gammaproteobacteria bacterium]MCP5136162.1 hypothetical protein [Gammaproteobacteria bacterium]
MVKRFGAVALMFGLLTMPVFSALAADEALQMCEAKADDEGLRGADRRDFIADCLAETATDANKAAPVAD